MPNFSTTNTFAAAGVVANAFAGSAFEFVGRPSRVAIAMTCSVAAVDACTTTIQFGPEVQLEEGNIPVEGVVSRGPVLPDDILVDDVAAAGDRLVVRITNTLAGANVVRTKARILPLQ